jgi:hypothetical protein
VKNSVRWASLLTHFVLLLAGFDCVPTRLSKGGRGEGCLKGRVCGVRTDGMMSKQQEVRPTIPPSCHPPQHAQELDQAPEIPPQRVWCPGRQAVVIQLGALHCPGTSE